MPPPFPLLTRAQVFLGEMETPTYVAHTPEVSQRMVVAPETADVRPFVVCAILRNVTFTQESYNSFIDLQDKVGLVVGRLSVCGGMWCAMGWDRIWVVK